MDGNGRWAKKRGLPRKFGHREGAKAFKKLADYCREAEIHCATFYAFSTENQKRPKDEVEALLRLFDEYLDDIREMDSKNVRMKFIGDLSFFPDSTREKMLSTEDLTKNNTGFTCVLALNYGGRDEILHAVKKIAADGCSLESLDEKSFAEYLYTKDLPDVDLIVRTGGEQRLSNFLIWQAAYAEYYYTDTLFPDFGKKELEKALAEFGERSRRFGNI
jgi:undecaprenyl diphosphate synthase